MKRFKAILGVLMVFLLGAAAGGFAVYHAERHGFEAFLAGRGHETGDVIVRRLTRSLDLDAAQREKVRAIVAETHKEILEIRKPLQQQVEGAIDRSRARVRALLRPDQQAIFDRLQAERRARKERESR